MHGCYDTLVALLQKVEYRPRHDNLILVGDLVNKGPKSQQVSALEPDVGCWTLRVSAPVCQAWYLGTRPLPVLHAHTC